VTARAGETTTVKLKLQNANTPPEALALSVTGAPDSWKVTFLGGGQPIGAAMASPNESVSLDLRIEVPAGAPTSTSNLMVHARGGSQNVELPLRVALGGDLPAKLSVKTKLPSLRGSAKSSFEYTFTVSNDSGKNLVVSLASEAPPNFQTAFTESFGSQEISSIPIDAGQNKDLKIKVTPPGNVEADRYDALILVAAEGVTAQAPVTLEITGQPKLRLAAKDGRLSGQAEAGAQTAYTLTVTNDGSAPAEAVELSATPPSDWKLDFQPKTIDRLDASETREVVAQLTPSAKALAGDYMTTMRANAKVGDSASADFRVTVTTSTIWGAVGLGVIAIALLVLVGAVARFGRR
jgi:uncharacterized repeat protein (TIGR01451 family)